MERRGLGALAAALLMAAGAAAQPIAAGSIEQDRLMETLRSLPTARSARGTIEAQRGLVRTERLIVDELRAMGYEPELQPLTWNLERERSGELGVMRWIAPGEPEFDEELARTTWHNIIVEIKGAQEPAEVLVVGAHFDAHPETPGADDNGTGTAALLEVARALRSVRPARTVRLIFFNLEELGMIGSAEYIRRYKEDGRGESERILGMVSLEMLGYFSDEPGSQRSPLPAVPGVFEPPTVGDFIGIATTRSHAAFAEQLDEAMRSASPDLKTVVVARFIPDLPLTPRDLLRSDHGPFLSIGIAGVIVTDTSNFRNPNYHRPTDVVETIDASRFTLVARAVAGAVVTIAGVVDEGATAPSPAAPGVTASP